jgi:hypothetical protein
MDGKEGKYIWTEYKCPNVVSEGASLCSECCKKLPKHKYQSNPKCDHGIIGGPYPADSKLYGSPFYVKQLKEGWTISEADETRAKDAVAKALSEMAKKKVVSTEQAAIVPTDVAVASAPPTVAAVAVALKKPRVYKKKSVIPDISPVAVDPQTVLQVKPQMLESMSPPIMVAETIIVKVSKIKCQGKEYYLDSKSSKLYEVTKTGVGAYKGRYKSEQLYECADSDDE